jgi:PEP-CTERM motif
MKKLTIILGVAVLFTLLIASNVFAAEPVPLPEPTSILLLSLGLIGLAGIKRKFKK